MKTFNVNINLTALKILGILVALVGCYGFIYGIHSGLFVMESITVMGMGLGVLGYRKHLITKNGSFNDKKE